MDEKWEVQPRSDLDQLVEKVAHGESVELTRGGKTVARLVPVTGSEQVPPSWDELVQLRKRAQLPVGMTIKDLIDNGRTE